MTFFITRSSSLLGQHFPDHAAVYIGQTKLPALVLECQSLVIDAHQVQDRGVQVVNVDRILGDVVAERIGPTKSRPAANSASVPRATSISSISRLEAQGGTAVAGFRGPVVEDQENS